MIGSRIITRSAAAILLLAGLVLTACSATRNASSADDGSAACDSAFASAASVDSMHDTVSDLYPAVKACRTVEQWMSASQAHPEAISEGVDPRMFLGNVCTSTSAGLGGEPLCRAAMQLCKTDAAVGQMPYCMMP